MLKKETYSEISVTVHLLSDCFGACSSTSDSLGQLEALLEIFCLP